MEFQKYVHSRNRNRLENTLKTRQTTETKQNISSQTKENWLKKQLLINIQINMRTRHDQEQCVTILQNFEV